MLDFEGTGRTLDGCLASCAMRFAFLILVFLAIIVGGIVKAELAVLGYVGFSLMRPDLLAWRPGPFLFAIAVLALLSSLRKGGELFNIFQNPFSLSLLGQLLLISLSSVLAVNPSLSWAPLNIYVRVILVQLMIPVTITSVIWFRRLLLVIVVSLGVVIVKFGLFGLLMSGGSLVRGMPGSMMADSNGLALAAVMVLPIAWYCIFLVDQGWQKAGLAGLVVCSMATVVSTGSRGNTLAMGVILLLLIWRSKYKVIGAVILAVLSLPILYVAGQRFADRMSTISSYEEDLSASSRVELWRASWGAIRDHPILGVGYGEDNWVAVSSGYLGRANHLKLHNTYLQMATDCGLPFFLVYVATLWGAIVWLGKSARRMKALHPELEPYPLAIQGGLLGFGIGSTFYSRGDFEFFYTLLLSTSAWYLIEKKLLTSSHASAESNEVWPLRRYQAGADISSHPVR